MSRVGINKIPIIQSATLPPQDVSLVCLFALEVGELSGDARDKSSVVPPNNLTDRSFELDLLAIEFARRGDDIAAWRSAALAQQLENPPCCLLPWLDSFGVARIKIVQVMELLEQTVPCVHETADVAPAAFWPDERSECCLLGIH
jgi:hypothetical protein